MTATTGASDVSPLNRREFLFYILGGVNGAGRVGQVATLVQLSALP